MCNPRCLQQSNELVEANMSANLLPAGWGTHNLLPISQPSRGSLSGIVEPYLGFFFNDLFVIFDNFWLILEPWTVKEPSLAPQ